MKIVTITSECESKIKEKGSVFIGKAFPVKTVEDAEEIQNDIKKQFYDATHHCYCYQLLDGQFKYSDDGEPNGTAGIRIQNAINHFNLTNILVVVIRYFGGTKLGVGPLGKAYYASAESVLQKCNIIEKDEFIAVRIEYDYPQTKTVHHFLNKFDAREIENLFESGPVINCFINIDKLEAFKENMIKSTNNSVNITTGKSKFI